MQPIGEPSPAATGPEALPIKKPIPLIVKIWGVLICIGVVVWACTWSYYTFTPAGQAATSAANLSDAPVSACDGVSDKFFPTAPGTISMQVDGTSVTHFHANTEVQLVYVGASGDSFAVSDPNSDTFLPTTASVEAVPYFDGSIQTQDETSTSLPITAQEIHGNTLTLPMRFPFTNPVSTPDNTLLQTGGTPYTQPGPYCLDVHVPYTRPDGQQAVVAAFIGVYEEPAP